MIMVRAALVGAWVARTARAGGATAGEVADRRGGLVRRLTVGLRRIYARASFARTLDKMPSQLRVCGCAGPQTRRRILTTSRIMVSASSRSSPVVISKSGVDAVPHEIKSDAPERGSVLIQTQVVAGVLGSITEEGHG